MNNLAPIVATSTAPMPGDIATGSGDLSPLSAPLLSAPNPQNALEMMLMSIEAQGRENVKATEAEVNQTRERLKKAQKELQEQLKKALDAARKARKKKKKRGFFGKISRPFVKYTAKAVARTVEAVKDAVVVPAAMTKSLAQNITDPQALGAALSKDIAALNESSEFETVAEGFTKGVASFATDLADYQLALAHAMATGDTEALEKATEQLWMSFEQNILDNPDFWTVVERVAQGAALAGAAATGGVMLGVAIGAIAMMEADKQFGVVDALPKDMRPYVRVGLSVALAVAGAGSSTALDVFHGATALLRGIDKIDDAIDDMAVANRRARDIERQADMQETLNEMGQLRRLLDSLLALYEDQNDDKTTNSELGNQLVQTQAAAEAAVVMRA